MKSLDSLRAAYDYIRLILDIGILTFILYKAYELIVKTNGMQIIRAAVIVGLAYAASIFLHLETLQWILNVRGRAFSSRSRSCFSRKCENSF